jgi:hypothetical protein
VKYLPRVLIVLSAGLLATLSIHAQPQTGQQPKFQFDIQPAAQGGPKYTVTNLSDKAITACVIELSIWSEGKGQSRTVWDAPIQGERPLEAGASMTKNLGHIVGAPLPDKMDVIAGIWADGETFGQADWVKIILQGRASWASQYRQATALLQRGLDQNWTRDQYLEVLKTMPDSVPMETIRSTLEAYPQVGGKPKLLERLVRRLLELLNRKSKLLRQAMTPARVTSAP